MKLLKNKLVLIFTFLSLIKTGTIYSQNFTVTMSSDLLPTSDGASSSPTSGELRFCVNKALYYLHFNPGATVNIYFNVTSLVNLKQTIQIPNGNPSSSSYNYDLNGGTIVFQPATGATSPQGITCQTGMTNFLSIFNVTAGQSTNNCEIDFVNLTVQDFKDEVSFANSSLSRVFFNLNDYYCKYFIKASNCSFKDNQGEFKLHGFRKFETISCDYLTTSSYFNTVEHISLDPYSHIQTNGNLFSDIKIGDDLAFLKNNFSSSLTSLGSNNIFGVIFFITSHIDNSIQIPSQIKNNNFEKIHTGISIERASNIEFQPNILHNTFTNCQQGINLVRPHVVYEIDNNNFGNNAISDIVVGSFYLGGNNSYQIDDVGIKLIRQEDIGFNNLVLKNYNNNFNYLSTPSIYSIRDMAGTPSNWCFYDNKSEIYGYEISKIQLTNNWNLGAHIRGNKIFGSYIDPVSRPNCSTSSALYDNSAQNVSFLNNALSLSVTFNNQMPAVNNKFIVDFYKSFTSGYIDQYLGHTDFQYTNGTTIYPITFISGLVSCGEEIYYTITGVGDGTNLSNGVGTSGFFTVNIPCPSCPQSISVGIPDGDKCVNEPINFYVNPNFNGGAGCIDQSNFTYHWYFGDGTESIDQNAEHIYDQPGTYTVTVNFSSSPLTCGTSTVPINCSALTATRTITIKDDCCPTCLPTMQLAGGKKYVVGAWVSEKTKNKAGFSTPEIYIYFTDQNGVALPPLGPFKPKGTVIDGWQRIDEVFTVPVGAAEMDLMLKNSSTPGGEDVYFDDIRVHPFDASFKSYVYDPVTLKFVAELDNNNYATFYEYDQEGKLVRVKKETERRTMTIKESRNVSIKKE